MRQNVQAIVYEDAGGYVAECRDLNAVTQGDSLDEVLANLREVIALALDGEDPQDLGLADRPTILVTLEIEPLRRAG